MQTYIVNIQLGTNFRDVYVQANDEGGAVRAARRLATAKERQWAAFVI
jgi:hypothetical protein